LVCRLVSGVPSERTNNYPESGRGLGHVTPTIFGIQSNISLKLFELGTSNLIHGSVWAMPSRRINNFPESSRGLGHVTLTIFGSTVGYPSDSLPSCILLCFDSCLIVLRFYVFYVLLLRRNKRWMDNICYVMLCYVILHCKKRIKRNVLREMHEGLRTFLTMNIELILR